jgi:hypothetical protein
MSALLNPPYRPTAEMQAGLYYARRRNRARQALQNLPLWSADLSVADGAYYQYGGNAYQALGAGTTGSTAPIVDRGQQSDGAVNWVYVDPQVLIGRVLP